MQNGGKRDGVIVYIVKNKQKGLILKISSYEEIFSIHYLNTSSITFLYL